jgi:hypothetical protein
MQFGISDLLVDFESGSPIMYKALVAMAHRFKIWLGKLDFTVSTLVVLLCNSS